MSTTCLADELSQLPEQVYQARCAVLQAEQQLLQADRHYQHLRTRQYLAACASGDGHFKATGVAAASPEVVAAREARDRWEAHYKQLAATHTYLRDRFRVLICLRAVGDGVAIESGQDEPNQE